MTDETTEAAKGYSLDSKPLTSDPGHSGATPRNIKGWDEEAPSTDALNADAASGRPEDEGDEGAGATDGGAEEGADVNVNVNAGDPITPEPQDEQG